MAQMYEGEISKDKSKPRIARYRKRWKQLETQIASWISHWREISEHLLPRKVLFQRSDYNRGEKKNNKIVNESAISAMNILTSGMHGAITSPSRPWFRLVFSNPAANAVRAGREWLADVESRIREVFARSNIYTALPSIYEDLAAWGCACVFIEDDDQDVIRADVQPIGSFRLVNDSKRRVRTVYRETGLTVEQMVQKFGYDACSLKVRQLWDRGEMDDVQNIIHVVEPNDAMDPDRVGPDGMRYRSLWYEQDEANDVSNDFLGQRGYFEFPALCPRWKVKGNDPYGRSPAMEALGSIKELQHWEKRKMEALDKIVRPPLNAPASLQAMGATIIPNEVNYLETNVAQNRVTPAIEIPHEVVTRAREEIAALEARIARMFFADLFLMITTQTRPNTTAREIEERHEEKMLQLGPVLERLHDELLGPLISRTYEIMERKGLIPEPPREIQGLEWKVEYISILAHSQKLLSTVAIERLAEFTLRVSEAAPSALDKIDIDRVIEQFADLLGAPPDLIRPDSEVQKLRRAQAEAQAAAQAAEIAKSTAAAAKDVGSINLGDDNAMAQIARGMGTDLGGVAA